MDTLLGKQYLMKIFYENKSLPDDCIISDFWMEIIYERNYHLDVSLCRIDYTYKIIVDINSHHNVTFVYCEVIQIEL